MQKMLGIFKQHKQIFLNNALGNKNSNNLFHADFSIDIIKDVILLKLRWPKAGHTLK